MSTGAGVGGVGAARGSRVVDIPQYHPQFRLLHASATLELGEMSYSTEPLNGRDDESGLASFSSRERHARSWTQRSGYSSESRFDLYQVVGWAHRMPGDSPRVGRR